jgi:thioredoxin reductase (NADPH)
MAETASSAPDYGKKEFKYTGPLTGDNYDVVIIGSGPGGLAAGVYSARRNMRTLIIGELLGGQMNWTTHIENYPGVEEITGPELAKRMAAQAHKFGCEIKADVVTNMALKGEKKTVRTRSKEYTARVVIIATGAGHRKLGIPGEEKFVGKGVSYCATCDAPLFRGKRVAVVGGSDSAVNNAIFITEFASETYLIHRRDKLRAEAANQKRLKESKVKVLWNTVAKEINGSSMVEAIVLEDVNTHEKRELPVDGVFLYVGVAPATELAKAAGVEVGEKGFIKTDQNQKTNIDGVYAAGDVTGGILQVSEAVGEGSIAATRAYNYLVKY